MPSNQQIQQEIEQEFGFFPAFFTPAPPVTDLLAALWHNYQALYQQNPLPCLFKAKLFLLLSRYCSVPSGVLHQSICLYRLGISSAEIYSLLQQPYPHSANLSAEIQYLHDLEKFPVTLPFNPEIERSLLSLCCCLFLYPDQAEAIRSSVRLFLGETLYAYLISLLIYIKLYHQWIDQYPELTQPTFAQVQPLLVPLLSEVPELKDFFKKDGVINPLEQPQSENLQLQHQSEYLQTILDHAPMVIFLKDLQGRYFLVNRQFEILVGRSRTQILGKTDLDIFPLELAQDFQQKDHWVRSLCVPFEFEENVALFNREYTYLTYKFPLFNPEGAITSTGGIAIDITEKKRRETELQSLNECLEELVQKRTDELQTIFEALPDQIFMIERDTMQISFCNNSLAQVSGYIDRRELQGKTIFEVYPPVQAAYFAQQNQQVFETGETLHTQETLNFQQQTIHLDTYKIPLKRADGEVYALIGTSRDISELVQARQALADRTQQLEATNQELESFSYSVSHDLRAPLRHISGFVEALQDRLQDLAIAEDNKVKHYLQVIEDSCTRMRQLIDGLLSLSQVGRRELTFTTVNLPILVEQSLDMIRSTFGDPQVSINCHIGSLPQVYGDRALLQQVFVNLLHNAVKFSRKPHPSQNNHPSDDRSAISITIDTLSDGTLYIQDQGVGFSMRSADQLFGVFQRLHRSQDFEGMGVGLAIVQRIIHRHGGRIWADSQPNQGATFYFTLPIIDC